MTLSVRTGGSRAVLAFLRERYLPLYPVYLTLWVAAVESLTVVLAGGSWRPDGDTVLRILALISAGAFLRMVDDVKDLDYDRQYNPTRPLVENRITVRELQAAMIPAAGAAVLLALMISPLAAAVLSAALCYGLVLWVIDVKVAWVRERPIVSLVVVCPAQFLVTAFIMVGQPGIGMITWWRLIAVPVVFTSAFMHVEFARKTTRSTQVIDPHSYSASIGVTPSAVIGTAFGVFAVVLELALTAPWAPAAWLPAAAVVLPCYSAWCFLRRRRDDYPQSWPTVFVVFFYLSIVVQGLIHH